MVTCRDHVIGRSRDHDITNLEAKFFGPFQMLHLIEKQSYKLGLPRKWKIHDVFHVSMLE